MAARCSPMLHFWAAGWSNGWRPDHWIIYAVEQGNVADAEASTACITARWATTTKRHWHPFTPNTGITGFT